MVEQMYFSDNSGRGQATPLKVIVGDYEISMAGDNSCADAKELTRLDIRVYKGTKIIEDICGIEFDTLVEVVGKYRALVKMEEFKRGLECEENNPCVRNSSTTIICRVHAQFVTVNCAYDRCRQRIFMEERECVICDTEVLTSEVGTFICSYCKAKLESKKEKK